MRYAHAICTSASANAIHANKRLAVCHMQGLAEMEEKSGIQSCIYESPVGQLKLEATAEGICRVKWLKDGEGEDDQMQPEGSDVEDQTLARQHLKTCKKWLDAYFSGSLLKSPTPKPPLVIPMKGKSKHVHSTMCLLLTVCYRTVCCRTVCYRTVCCRTVCCSSWHFAGSFFHHVWSTLSTTGVGETLSYAELASLTGRPLAARAVGQAMKKHSIPLLIPCHRVVKSGGGGVGNYSGGEGPSTKRWLLEHEKKMLNTAP